MHDITWFLEKYWHNDMQCGCFYMTRAEDGKLLSHLEWPSGCVILTTPLLGNPSISIDPLFFKKLLQAQQRVVGKGWREQGEKRKGVTQPRPIQVQT